MVAESLHHYRIMDGIYLTQNFGVMVFNTTLINNISVISQVTDNKHIHKFHMALLFSLRIQSNYFLH
jgi:hypothetical protein